MNKVSRLEGLSYAVVMAVALCSFALSFNNIQHVAFQNGYDQLSYLVPLIIDGALIAFAIVSLNVSATYNKQNNMIKFLIALFVLVSVGFNWLDSSETIAGKALAIIIPAALFFSFESVLYQLKTRMENETETEIQKLHKQLKKVSQLLTESKNEIVIQNRIISELKAIPKIPETLNPLGIDFFLYLAGSIQMDELIEKHDVAKQWIGRTRNRLTIDSESVESN